MYNLLLNIVLPASTDLSRDSPLLSGAGELFPEKGTITQKQKLPLVKGSLCARHCPKPLRQIQLVPFYR